MTLANLEKGKKGVISTLDVEAAQRSYMLSLGLIPGDTVEVLKTSVFGSIMTIRYGNNQLVALRKDVAQKIYLEI